MIKCYLRQFFGYSIWIFLCIIVDRANWSVDQFILGAVSGTISVSIYSVASHISSMFVNLSTAISNVLLPKVSKMIANNAKDEQITDEFIKVGRIQYYIIFLIASGFVLLGKEFIIAWAGQEFVNSYYITIILIIPLGITLIQCLGVSIMQAKNMHKFRSILLICIAIVNIAISIPLAKKYDAIGSTIGTSLSLIIGDVFIINIYYYKKVGINVIKFWKEILTMTVPFLFSILIIITIMKFVTLHGFLNVIVFGFLYTTLYSIVCNIFVMNEYEKSIINKIVKKCINKK